MHSKPGFPNDENGEVLRRMMAGGDEPPGIDSIGLDDPTSGEEAPTDTGGADAGAVPDAGGGGTEAPPAVTPAAPPQ